MLAQNPTPIREFLRSRRILPYLLSGLFADDATDSAGQFG